MNKSDISKVPQVGKRQHLDAASLSPSYYVFMKVLESIKR